MEPRELNRENYAEYLWANYTKLIGEGYTEKPLEYTEIFKTVNSNRYEERYSSVNGLPVWEENFEGNAYNEAQRSKGFDSIIRNKRYDQSFTVTWEYMQDNMERAMGGRGINGDAQGLGRGCRVAQELSTAEIINTGFTNVGYDGTSLFSTRHPLAEGTFANTPENEADKTLNDANLKKAIIAMSNQVDGIGMKIQVKPNIMGVSTDLYFTALTIINSALVSGTNNNDKNTISLVAPLRVVSMSYWDNGIWVLKDTSIDNLIFQWRERPEYGYFTIQGTPDTKFWGRARWGVGYIDWRGLYGAKQAV